MTNQITNHKCPSCTAPLRFDASSGKLVCDYCDSRYEVSQIEKLYKNAEEEAKKAFAQAKDREKKADEQKNSNEQSWDTSRLEMWNEDGMTSYSCPSCGAVLICESTTAATSCPYCGNSTVIPGQLSGVLKPKYIIPFKLDKEAAKKALKRFYKDKKFLPDSFSQQNRIDEIKGIYVPFWLFDGVATADTVFECKNFRTYRSGSYQISETDHFRVRRAGNVPFSKIPVDASSKTPDSYMDAIEPFDYSQLCEFSTAYLPGFLADKYDVSAEDCAGRADTRAKNTAISAMKNDVVGYESTLMTDSDVTLNRGEVNYGLLPVYMLSTKWHDKNYLFAMNGQTGKFVGELPIDKKKYWKWFSSIALITTATVAAFLLLML